MFVLVGKPTDESGFGGAAFASEELGDADDRGAVQLPDPFLERVLLVAGREAFVKDSMSDNKFVAARAKMLLKKLDGKRTAGNIVKELDIPAEDAYHFLQFALAEGIVITGTGCKAVSD